MRAFIVPLSLLATLAMAQDRPAEPPGEDAAAAAASRPAADAVAPEATVAAAVSRPTVPGAASEPVAAAKPADGVKTMSGMSILGNEEAPKALVIVPWKSSKLGDGLGVSNALDESPRPVDKEVFMRELHYYALRSGDGE